MSLLHIAGRGLHILERHLTVLSRREADKRIQFGVAGEMAATEFIEALTAEYRSNVIIPPMYAGYLVAGEMDFIFFYKGTLFCVEAKRWQGRLSWREDGTILQEKGDKSTRVNPGPWTPVYNFVHHLKGYVVAHIDPRFGGLRIVPVVCFFREETDISDIYDPNRIIYIDELQEFCERWGFENAAHTPPKQWIVNALNALPTWDQIMTTDGQIINGVLAESVLTYKSPDGQKHTLPLWNVVGIQWQRPSGLFGWLSSHDDMVVGFRDDSTGNTFTDTFKCVSGTLVLQRVTESQKHRLRNLQHLFLGTVNNPHWTQP